MLELMDNPISLKGIAFLEFASEAPSALSPLFEALGLHIIMRHQNRNIALYEQNQIRFLLNADPSGFAGKFAKSHGPSIPSMGWLVENAAQAQRMAVERGAVPATGDYRLPAVAGIGDSIIYFVDSKTSFEAQGFATIADTLPLPSKGFLCIDHLTNNVPKGTMHRWADFYKNIFGFTEVRYFDIKGKKTGLQSFALRSPCGTFCIPINEGTEDKSQINEYLREYKGPGIQHVALLTEDIIRSLKALKGGAVKMLDIDADYYEEAFQRVPHVTEDRAEIRDLGILVDGDEKGYLLQIFTQNVIGPIFFEIIQRKNHHSFGEGNFGALFRSIERDQEKRGAL